MKSIAFKIPKYHHLSNDKRSIFYESELKYHWAYRSAYFASLTWENYIKHHISVINNKENPAKGFAYSYDHVDAPAEVSLYIGDCIRCMRTSLDYLVASLAREANIDDSQIIFPFSETLENLRDSFTDVSANGKKKHGRQLAMFNLQKSYPGLDKLIIDQIQPFSRDYGSITSGDLLWRVITSDAIDKHRLMTPRVTNAKINSIKFADGSGLIGEFTITGGPAFYSSSPIVGNPEIEYDLLFDMPSRLEGLPVMQTLADALDAVLGTIMKFKMHFKNVDQYATGAKFN